LLFYLGADIWCYVWATDNRSLLCEGNIRTYTTDSTYWKQFSWWHNGGVFTPYFFPRHKIQQSVWSQWCGMYAWLDLLQDLYWNSIFLWFVDIFFVFVFVILLHSSCWLFWLDQELVSYRYSSCSCSSYWGDVFSTKPNAPSLQIQVKLGRWFFK